MNVWINGALVPEHEARISVFDHGLLVGDGVFETVKVVHGIPFAVTRHLNRLANSAAALGLPAPNLVEIRKGVLAVAATGANFPLARLRITVTGGISPLGSERGESPVTVVIALAEQKFPTPAADVVVVPWRRNEHGALAGLKTTSYAENVRALAYAAKRGGSEAIFVNMGGHLCEGTGSNIFVVTGGRLVTPSLASGCLAGVTRALILELTQAEETDIPAEALSQSDEAFLTGTTRDVQVIRRVDGCELPAAPGPVSSMAARLFTDLLSVDPDP